MEHVVIGAFMMMSLYFGVWGIRDRGNLSTFLGLLLLVIAAFLAGELI